MSYSSLYVVDKDDHVVIAAEYQNSWVFSPTVWDVITQAVLPRTDLILSTEHKLVRSIIGTGAKIWPEVNRKMNDSSDIVDRTLWELTQQQITRASDAQFVAQCIDQFVEKYKTKKRLLTEEVFFTDSIIDRFLKIKNDIANIDKDAKYFIFKNTSVDDGVECLFRTYDDEEETFTEAMTRLVDNGEETAAQFTVYNEDRTNIEFRNASNYLK